MSTSMDGGGGCNSSISGSSVASQRAGSSASAYEHMYMARSGSSGVGSARGHYNAGNSDSEMMLTPTTTNGSGKMRAYSIDQYDQHQRYPQAAPRNLDAGGLGPIECLEPRSYNPNRKLRRSRDNYGAQFSIE